MICPRCHTEMAIMSEYWGPYWEASGCSFTDKTTGYRCSKCNYDEIVETTESKKGE